jgi:opacity protein-like surface antigen
MKKMHRNLQPVVLAILACIVMSTASYGQEPRAVEINGQLGVVSGIGTHGSFGGGLGVALTPSVLGYGEVSYIPLGSASSSVMPVGIQSSASGKAINFNAGAQFQFSRSAQMVPFAGLGLGILHASSSYSSSIGGVTVTGRASGNDLYFNVGGGVRYYVSDRWGVKPELMIFAGPDAFVRFGGGIFYRLGR